MRALSIVSLLLVFISCIITIVNNVKAVNYYMAHRTKEDEQVDCDYIECVATVIDPGHCIHDATGTARCPTRLLVSSGLSSPRS